MLGQLQRLLDIANDGALAHELYKKDYKFESSGGCISVFALVCIFIVLLVLLLLFYWMWL